MTWRGPRQFGRETSEAGPWTSAPLWTGSLGCTGGGETREEGGAGAGAGGPGARVEYRRMCQVPGMKQYA